MYRVNELYVVKDERTLNLKDINGPFLRGNMFTLKTYASKCFPH